MICTIASGTFAWPQRCVGQLKGIVRNRTEVLQEDGFAVTGAALFGGKCAFYDPTPTEKLEVDIMNLDWDN